MTPLPEISVVLPFFNAESTLSEAVRSILAQTFQDWELVLFDDGSTDDSARMAESFAARDARIRMIRSSHVGMVAALRRACRDARGTYLARMDADDWSDPRRLAMQAELLKGDPAVGLCGTQVRMFGESIGSGIRRYEEWINGLVTHEDMQRELFVECPIPHPSFMMPRSIFEQISGYEDHGWAEDYDLCMRVVLSGKRLGKVAEPLLDWRESAGRLSRTSERYSVARFRALKRHYLARMGLWDGKELYQWGAGEVGKPWLREWTWPKPAAVVDIHPRKVGRRIHGVPVISPEDLPPPGTGFCVVAVGAPGARADIRQWLLPRGYEEGVDFVFVA